MIKKSNDGISISMPISFKFKADEYSSYVALGSKPIISVLAMMLIIDMSELLEKPIFLFCKKEFA